MNIADHPDQYVFENRVFVDQRLYNQERNSSLMQEDPEPHQIKDEQEEMEPQQVKEELYELELENIKEETEELDLQQIKEETVSPVVKEEQEEHFITSEADHLLLKEETDSSMETSTEMELYEPEPNKDQLFPHRPDASMLDIKWQPQGNVHRLDAPHHHVFKEKIHSDLKLFNQERVSSLDLEEPHPLQVKEEEDAHGSSGESEQVLLNQETDGLMVTEKCDHTGNEFHGCCHLKDHMRNGTSENLFTCETCGKCYKHRSNLVNHILSHTVEKRFHCCSCDKKFMFASQLEMHVRTHTGVKPFTCETCGKCFSRRGDLKIHMKTHTAEKPYACTEVGI
ncbi:uncharacterized protein KZ484_021876 [Pholidichthys leucotaenia]